MGILRALLKLVVGVVLFGAGLVGLVALFELPPFLIKVTLGPMHPELAQVYTMFEIGIILCIVIFLTPVAYGWYSRRWERWMAKDPNRGA